LWTRELLAPDAIRKVGAFDPDKVRRLLAKLGGQGDRSHDAAMGLGREKAGRKGEVAGAALLAVKRARLRFDWGGGRAPPAPGVLPAPAAVSPVLVPSMLRGCRGGPGSGEEGDAGDCDGGLAHGVHSSIRLRAAR
jgi:hypothetical protein